MHTASYAKNGKARFNVSNNANTEKLYAAVTKAKHDRQLAEAHEKRAQEARDAEAGAAALEQTAVAPEAGGLVLSLQSSHTNQ